MRTLSQKELLQEGFIGKIAQLTKGGLAMAGKAAEKILPVTTGYIKGAVGGAKEIVQAGKAGYKAEQLKQMPFVARVKKQLEDSGYFLISLSDTTGKKKRGSAVVARLDYDNNGKPIAGAAITKPLIYSIESGRFEILKNPGSRQ
jgi:hypothetical protein